MANLGANFYPKLVEMCKDVGIKPEDLLAVMKFESGIDPSSENWAARKKNEAARREGRPDVVQGASGLIQFMPATLKALGYSGTMAQFRALSGEEQLPWIKKYIQGKNTKFDSAPKYYTANLFPVALGLPGVKREDPNTPILEKNPEALPNGKSKKYADIGVNVSAVYEKAAYNENAGLDHGSKGAITYGDLMKTMDSAKQSKSYQSAIAAMHESTGHISDESKVSPSMVAKKQAPQQSIMEYLSSLLDKYVSSFSIASEDISLKKIYKIALPTNNILIKISAPDYNSAIEFSRILSSALDEDLLSTSYSYSDGENVEVECSIQGPEKECFAAVEQMSLAISEVFKEATAKIGNIIITTECVMNKKSSYQSISLKTASANYRQFLLKFI